MSFALRSKPERIVCLTEETTELLYLLGEERRVVGVSAYACRPPRVKEEKPVVSAFIGGSVEKIQALEPDVVIGFSDIQAELAKKLIAANLQVLIFNQRSIQEILDVIVIMGRLVGAEARALELCQGYIDRLRKASDEANARSSKPRVYFEEWDMPMISGIRWVSELLELAGAIDIFADRAHGKLAKDRFVEEQEVVDRAPDMILASWCGKPVDKELIRARRGWRGVPAVENDQIHELDSSVILQPGPACLTDGLDALEQLVETWHAAR